MTGLAHTFLTIPLESKGTAAQVPQSICSTGGTPLYWQCVICDTPKGGKRGGQSRANSTKYFVLGQQITVIRGEISRLRGRALVFASSGKDGNNCGKTACLMSG
ncbi:hypothetical protein AVEN_208087-1 [Araneus ventricosus]|uniref:Uncharacterized protein n=1 Tax=Araneus ventricosus TaxID=182803 RepID=A0A4Y2FZF7_ARAVE|nr:hypothetical protein AVEN_208087-1 [Araneus ventricosus]